jgi:hypothetical protein
MTDLKMPNDGPRVPPLSPQQVDEYVLSEYDKSMRTWGIPNNLIRTMSWLPRLGLTEVDYVNSFLFDLGFHGLWPRPGGTDPKDRVLYPQAGFVNRVTKELVISVVSLMNRSRYSITHHTVIAFTTLSAEVAGATPEEKAQRAEAMLLHVVNGDGQPDFEDKTFEKDSQPLYSAHDLACLRFAVKLRGDAHDISDAEVEELRSLLRGEAQKMISSGPLKDAAAGNQEAYLDALVNSMFVELAWCIVHFAGLLNRWFIVLKVMDETDADRDGVDFVGFYNQVVPESIKKRNNQLLEPDGWGGITTSR